MGRVMVVASSGGAYAGRTLDPMPFYFYSGDGKPMIREDDGTERDATPREVLDHFQDRDANQTCACRKLVRAF
jgi:hypothetical protein